MTKKKRVKISFDFDGTLSRKSVQKYAKQLIDNGIDCIITTFRQKEYIPPDSNNDLFDVADSLGIKEIRFTEGQDKSSFLEDVFIHLDDDYNCLREIQRNSKCIPISVCTGNWQGKIERIIRRKGIH